MKKITLIFLLLAICATSAYAVYWSVPYEETKSVTIDHVVYKWLTNPNGESFVYVMGFDTDDSNLPEKIEIHKEILMWGNRHRVKKIRREAFRNCKKFHEFVLPVSIEEIETYAFADCKDIKLNIPKNTGLNDSIFYNSNITFTNNEIRAKYIRNHSFTGIHAKNIVLSSDLLLFGSYAAKEADIKRISFSNTDDELLVGKLAFNNCYATEVKLGNTMTLPFGMFNACPSLKRIIIPKADYYVSFTDNGTGYLFLPKIENDGSPITDCPSHIVSDCPMLEEIVLFNPEPQLLLDDSYLVEVWNIAGYTAVDFIDNVSGCTLKVPTESVNLYRNHVFWGKFKHIEGFQPGEYAEYTSIDRVDNDHATHIANDGGVIKATATDSGLHLTIPEPCAVEIYNLTGTLMQRIDHAGGTLQADLPKGIYLIRKSTI